ncbi:hypothetical protein B566_EDAN004626 [Ephemera danica]|nr:hypothetical protein B566_EDAN004626 [Ephemera danica]
MQYLAQDLNLRAILKCCIKANNKRQFLHLFILLYRMKLLALAFLLCNGPDEKYICLPLGQLYDCATRYTEMQCLDGKVCVPGQSSIEKACYTPANTCTRAGSFALTDLNPCVDFYMCGAPDAVPVYSRCSSGTFFNPVVQSCVRGPVQGCGGTASTTPPPTITPPPTTTPRPTTTPPPSSTSCSPEGIKRAVPTN